MAQSTGSNSHQHQVYYYNQGFEEAQRYLVQISEACSRSGHWPDPAPRYEWLLQKLNRFQKALPSILAPKGIKLKTLDDMLVAADFWEDRGNLGRASKLRDQVDCHQYCQRILETAMNEWCEGHPEEPPTTKILNLILDANCMVNLLGRPYGANTG